MLFLTLMTTVTSTMSVYTSTSATPQGAASEHPCTSSVGSDHTELTASSLFNTSDYNTELLLGSLVNTSGHTEHPHSSLWNASDYTEIPHSSLWNSSDYTDLPFNGSLSSSANSSVPEGCVVLQFTDFVPWDNPDTIISMEVEDAFDKFVSIVVLIPLYFIRYLTSKNNLN